MRHAHPFQQHPQPVQDEGEGLREQQTPAEIVPQETTKETASSIVAQSDEVVTPITTKDQAETKADETEPEKEQEPTEKGKSETEVAAATKEVEDNTKKDEYSAKEDHSAGEVTEPEAHKSDDGKGALSSPETKKKKDKKKRKGSKKREESPESSRSVPKLRKRSSRSDGSGSQG